MAVTGIEYTLFKTLRIQNILPLKGNILELGEANWYGDVDLNILNKDIFKFASEDVKQELVSRLKQIILAKQKTLPWEIAKVFWETFLQPKSMLSIDLHGTENALKKDLNSPIEFPDKFNIIMNLGTAEHVFNIYQAFKTVHDSTAPDGLMIHGMPFSGWTDHGFYSFNPTFYWDIAAANEYKIILALYAELNPLKIIQILSREQMLIMAKKRQVGENSLIYTVFRRNNDSQFNIPMQGYYSNSISNAASDAWKELR